MCLSNTRNGDMEQDAQPERETMAGGQNIEHCLGWE